MSLWEKIFGKKAEEKEDCQNSGIAKGKYNLEKILDRRFPYGRPLNDWRNEPDLKRFSSDIGQASYAWNVKKDPSGFRQLLPRLPSIDGKYKKYEVVYIWNARAFGALGDYNKAYEILEKGLQRCNDLAGLLNNYGDLNFEQRNPDALAWWMQSCMVGSSDAIPYLKLSVAADELGLHELSAKLLSATDILHEIRLGPDYESEIRQLTKLTPINIKTIFQNFAKFMEEFLPPSSFLPTSGLERSTFIIVERDSIDKAISRLLKR